MRKAVDVDFTIHGDDLQFVEIMLDSTESIIAEAGAMMYMDDTITMDAIFGDGSGRDEGKGLMGKMLGAGKRVVTGESLFMTEFTNRGYERRAVAFAGTYPGKIITLDIGDFGGEIICQRDSFLCAAKGIAIEIAFQKNIGAGLFGGEGFIMQRLIGDGLTFLHAGGTIIQKDLKPGEVFKLDTGCLVAMTNTINYDVEMVGNIKSAIFGGEGLFLATLKGPGSVWMQSLPFSRMARKILATGARGKSGGKGEGSLLGGIGIGDIFGND
ncbi:MAG: TIGR00266 family protein [Tissierellia bacterium]|nr:TIGR00266 family protein [Tissierellia bacterium]MDD4726296.1 TIGR00266 family protein [Tissierellia bacterium]